MLLCIEVMFFGISLNFVFFSVFLNYISGQIMALVILISAAAEGTIGLSLIIIASRLGTCVTYGFFSLLRG
jgi:NADH:ubiquinone oxidoreductase subunit K